MDKGTIQEYIESNYNELVAEFINRSEREFYEFCENEAITAYAMKIDEAKEGE